MRDRYQLLRDAHWDTKLACIQCQLRYQHGLEGDACLPQHEDIMPSTALKADVFAAEKQAARVLYQQGETLVNIAEEVRLSLSAVKAAVKGLRQGHKADSVAGRVLACLASDGAVWTKKALAEKLDIKPRSLTRPLQKLQWRAEIRKHARGKYKQA